MVGKFHFLPSLLPAGSGPTLLQARVKRNVRERLQAPQRPHNAGLLCFAMLWLPLTPGLRCSWRPKSVGSFFNVSLITNVSSVQLFVETTHCFPT